MSGDATVSLGIGMALAMCLVAAAVFALRKSASVRRRVHELLPDASVSTDAGLSVRCLVQGTLRAQSTPITTFDGTAAIVVRTRAGYVTQVGRTTYVRPTDFDIVAGTQAVIEDSAGACAFDTVNAVVIGETSRWEPDPATFAAALPQLWAKLNAEEREGIRDIVVTQTYVRDGSTGFVAGERAAAPSSAPPTSLRAAPPLCLTSLDDLPVIVSSGDLSSVRAEQLTPVRAYSLLAAFAFATALAVTVSILMTLR